MGGGREIVTVPTDFGVIGLAICYDLRMAQVVRIRSELPVLRDLVLTIEAPARR